MTIAQENCTPANRIHLPAGLEDSVARMARRYFHCDRDAAQLAAMTISRAETELGPEEDMHTLQRSLWKIMHEIAVSGCKGACYQETFRPPRKQLEPGTVTLGSTGVKQGSELLDKIRGA
jgi:hypothetical protein